MYSDDGWQNKVPEQNFDKLPDVEKKLCWKILIQRHNV